MEYRLFVDDKIQTVRFNSEDAVEEYILKSYTHKDIQTKNINYAEMDKEIPTNLFIRLLRKIFS